MSRREIAMETKTLYFAEWAWEDINNMDRYFETAINWRFIEED